MGRQSDMCKNIPTLAQGRVGATAPALCQGSKGTSQGPCHQSCSRAITTGLSGSGGQAALPWGEWKDTGAGAGTEMTLVGTQSYSCPWSHHRRAVEQHRPLLCPQIQTGPETLISVIVYSAICTLGSKQRAPEIPVPPTPLTL